MPDELAQLTVPLAQGLKKRLGEHALVLGTPVVDVCADVLARYMSSWEPQLREAAARLSVVEETLDPTVRDLKDRVERLEKTVRHVG